VRFLISLAVGTGVFSHRKYYFRTAREIFLSAKILSFTVDIFYFLKNIIQTVALNLKNLLS
jgi:hypothetical protein